MLECVPGPASSWCAATQNSKWDTMSGRIKQEIPYVRKAVIFGLVVLWLATLSGCRRPSEKPAPNATPGTTPPTAPQATSELSGPKIHHGRGVVIDIDKMGRYVVIRHQEIKGFMDPMTMPFHTDSPKLARSVRVGDEVEFTLEERPSEVVLTEIHKVPGS